METILVCDKLKKHYGSKCALSEVSLSVQSGRMVGLLGPNGSGKTTLMKLVAGFLTPTSGSVRICGLAPDAESKRLVSYLPDCLSVPKHERVTDVMNLYRDFFEDFRYDRAQAMLRDLGLNERDRLSTMSKGMLEKVQLVLAMSREARLYLLDEPLGGVDPAAREYILETILQNYNENAAVIFSTHLISDVENSLDDVIIIQNGSIVMADSVDAIRSEHGKSLDEVFREVFKCSASY